MQLRVCTKLHGLPPQRSPSRRHAVDSLDPSIRVPLMIARNSDRLDLSDGHHSYLPSELFDITNLTELSLSGNNFHDLPSQISNLTNLQKLQLAGNQLKRLPEELGALTHLRGLWISGNGLTELPQSFSNLISLEKCSASGNPLRQLPNNFSNLKALKEFECAGSPLQSMPVIYGMTNLEKLVLHGNALKEMPDGLSSCLHLKELSLQGNDITRMTDSNGLLPNGLRSLNLADNSLEQLSLNFESLMELESIVLYGNQLKTIPSDLLHLSKLKMLWLEGNPLNAATVHMIAAYDGSAIIGLDESHLSHLENHPCRSKRISMAQMPKPYETGYFKLIRERTNEQAKLLVVAFGGALGTPNWASVLRRVKDAISTNHEAPSADNPSETPVTSSPMKNAPLKMEPQERTPLFDILYVVDPHRSWYGGGGQETDRYAAVLEQICGDYNATLMVGKADHFLERR